MKKKKKKVPNLPFVTYVWTLKESPNFRIFQLKQSTKVALIYNLKLLDKSLEYTYNNDGSRFVKRKFKLTKQFEIVKLRVKTTMEILKD